MSCTTLSRPILRLNCLRSSRRTKATWVAQQTRDPFVRAAASDNFSSRAVYKLSHIQSKYRILRPSSRVVDLGFAPGSWSEYVVSIIDPKRGGRCLGVDLQPAAPVPGAEVLVGDFMREEVKGKIREWAGEEGVDVLLSDMMARTTGVSKKDHWASMDLCNAVVDFSEEVLIPRGHILMKIFQGEEDKKLEMRLKEMFKKVFRIKPPASRKQSKEQFLLGISKKDSGDQETVEEKSSENGKIIDELS